MIVCTPMFLNNAATLMLRQAMTSFSAAQAVQEGDELMLEFVGMTKDTDGWPMKKWKLTLRRNNAP